ncbi:NAD-dependent epimerase/dehydratase family protein [Amorphoplanes digitatis]|uniref:Nucleoside-diphosphate-sugar epimerase n=1 Tax=Actinoplanes digitatis TaxID=1868 RepID=A0A7W7MNJ1_9ACTN|nr:NAD(P)-dependent oxidoreductase [Actinoplanes digitatis]MBB4761108.1 nucleoside-diphosphate-sugar epimerase [Actinoplanes digitatis]GID92724.1 NAD-dependent epimerase [Actinoplanes digitatis]
MRLVVTGASGFCGAAVARLAAARGHEVLCLGRRPGPVGRHVAWDATGPAPDLAGADAVVHLAAAVGDPRPGRRAERRFRAVNVDGTARLLGAAAGRPVVWVSSASVYRPGPYAGPVREEHPADGQRGPYGRTKAAGERLALAAGAVALRPRAVYGEGDRHLLPRLRRVVRGGRAWLPGPDVAMSLTAVENLAAACLDALCWPGGAYNIADERPYSRDEVFGRVLGVPVRHIPAGLARAAAVVSPTLTRYAVDQLTDGMVLDLGRARAQGFRPVRTLADYLVSTTDERKTVAACVPSPLRRVTTASTEKT